MLSIILSVGFDNLVYRNNVMLLSKEPFFCYLKLLLYNFCWFFLSPNISSKLSIKFTNTVFDFAASIMSFIEGVSDLIRHGAKHIDKFLELI